jgi:hypothetical protein
VKHFLNKWLPCLQFSRRLILKNSDASALRGQCPH